MQCWYVVHTKPRAEFQAQHALETQHLEVYLPALPVKRANPRARPLAPFFSRYLFLHVDLETINFATLNWTPGVVGVLTAGDQALTVPDEVIALIRRHVDALAAGAPHLPPPPPEFRRGDVVTIQSGPMQGVDAIFDSYLSSAGRARVLVEMLARQTGAEIDVAQIHKTDPRALALRRSRRR